MIVFCAQTGFRYPADILDLRSQERVFQIMCGRILRAPTFYNNGVKTSYADAFTPGTGIASIRPIVAHARSGLCRRPVVSNDIWQAAVKLIENAMTEGNTLSTLGVGFRIRLQMKCDSAYVPSATTQLHNIA